MTSLSFIPSRARRMAGLTLIEILVVIVILSVLALMIVPNVMDKPDKARRVKATQDIAAITSALRMYKLDNRVYPTTEQGLQALVTKPTTGPIPPNYGSSGYLGGQLQKDPWGASYQYLHPGQFGEFDVWSYGADNQPGGEGDNADIGSWTIN